MNGLRRAKQKGFTLIEMVITIIILGIVAGLASQLLVQGFLGTQQAQVTDEFDWHARQGLERIARDLRELNPDNIIAMTTSGLQYVSSSGETVTYFYSAPNLTRNGDVLSTDISTFVFLYYDASGSATTTTADVRFVQYGMIFTIDGQVSPVYVTTIALRNPTS